jgi:hypothetical protein
MTRPDSLAQRLFRMRKAAGLTSYQLAEEPGWIRTKVSKSRTPRRHQAKATSGHELARLATARRRTSYLTSWPT